MAYVLRRRILSAGPVVAGVLSVFLTLGAADAQPQKVVELFTSQGCSSCPPADVLAEKMVEEDKDVLTLLMPVDYWDYLGWKDTLASPLHSARQRAYAARRGDRSVYTPQMVINGNEHVVGSVEPRVRAALSRANAFTADAKLNLSDMAVEVSVDGTLPRNAKMATVYFLRIREPETVQVGRGENAGRSITYVNVVDDLQPIGMWSGGSESFRMPKSKLIPEGSARCAVLIQLEGADGPGQIIGAAVMGWNSDT